MAVETAEDLEEQLRIVERSLVRLEERKRAIVKDIEHLRPKAEQLRNRIFTLRTVEANNVDWTQTTYAWSDNIRNILKEVFKFDNFKFKQLSAINAILSKQDLIVIMPTGGGKSLTYQLPALVTKGITLVVSPLLSLITDQINHLKELGINAVTINSTNSKTMSKVVYDAMAQGVGNIRLIYVTPEWLNKSKRFMTNLQKAHERGALDRIAIDEVHCCSMWGHDFRPDYKNLHIFKNVFPDIPIIGVTATATEKVILESQDLLGIHGSLVLKASYNRPNLFYKVKRKPSSAGKCAEMISSLIKEQFVGESGIIYTHSVNDSIELATELNKHHITSAAYHASMEADARDRVHSKWMVKRYQVICATVAFGMGIDKPDVRFVIHHSLPKSMENYYQESGRAGRDGLPAECILMYNIKDVFRVSAMVATSSQNGTKYLYEMVKYCIESAACRRAMIATHFDEMWDSSQCNKHCDNCKEVPDTTKIDVKKYFQQMLKLIQYSKEKFDTSVTCLRLMDTWFHVGATKKFRLPDIPVPKITRELGERILAYLITNDFLKENLHFTAYTTISYIGKGRNEPKETIMITVPRSILPKSMQYHSQLSSPDYHRRKEKTPPKEKRPAKSPEKRRKSSDAERDPEKSPAKRLKLLPSPSPPRREDQSEQSGSSKSSKSSGSKSSKWSSDSSSVSAKSVKQSPKSCPGTSSSGKVKQIEEIIISDDSVEELEIVLKRKHKASSGSDENYVPGKSDKK